MKILFYGIILVVLAMIPGGLILVGIILVWLGYRMEKQLKLEVKMNEYDNKILEEMR